MLWNFHKPTIILRVEKYFKNWEFICQTSLSVILEQGWNEEKTEQKVVRQVLTGSLIQSPIVLDGLFWKNS